MSQSAWDEKKIGVIREVSSTTLTVVIDPHITNLSKKIGEKIYLIGQIGSYVLVPVGKQYVIGIVSGFKKADINEQEKIVQRYIMTVTMVGSLKKGYFESGVSVPPTADMPVYVLEDKDLKVAFATYQKFNFSIGRLSLFENEQAYIDPNKFFGKHIAILGSSGAGKSCTVASILQKAVNSAETKIVVIDIHSEYKRAFPEGSRHFDIAGLELPYWLMNFEEITEMLIDPKDENAATQTATLHDLILAAKKSANQRLAESITADSPVFYDLNEVRAKIQFLDTEKITGPSGGKEGPYFGKFARFIVRLNTKMNDPRYAFIFKSRVCTDTESAKALLSMIFGLDKKSKITIMDMSGIPFDIVNTVAALIARIAFDFNFWNPNRRDLPILLVFEEAHNYLTHSGSGSKAAVRTVERIAKEGRKYGVSCMIVSQRPSEISETILSQCNSFVILRLLNPVDQAYMRRLVPDTFSGLDAAIPTLRQGEAIVLGDSMAMPLRVQIDQPSPEPDSSDINFYNQWKASYGKTDAGEVMERWWKQQRTWDM
ncbi:MAG: ATP-binding protein [Ignavibacteriae bacterium]|nr:ATP-binding protein [Ignavibacteriota bacterium]